MSRRDGQGDPGFSCSMNLKCKEERRDQRCEHIENVTTKKKAVKRKATEGEDVRGYPASRKVCVPEKLYDLDPARVGWLVRRVFAISVGRRRTRNPREREGERETEKTKRPEKGTEQQQKEY